MNRPQMIPSSVDAVLSFKQCLKIPYLGVRVRVRPFWRSGRVPGSGFTRFWIPARSQKTRIPKFTPMRFFFKDFSVFRGGIA